MNKASKAAATKSSGTGILILQRIIAKNHGARPRVLYFCHFLHKKK